MWKSIISTVVLGSLASVTLLYSTGSADARPRSCSQRYHDCTGRCLNLTDSAPCVVRTCIPQRDNCTRAEDAQRGSPPKGGKKDSDGKVVRDHRGKR